MRWTFILTLAALLGAGCRREEITSYRIPKGAETLEPMAQEKVPVQSPIQYQLPAGWEAETPEGMSAAQFSIAGKKAQLSLMSFQGERASQLDLVNIVRQSAGLPPLNDEQLVKIVEPVAIGDEKGSLINLGAATGSASNGVMVAVLPHEGMTWFFKLSGAGDVVTAQKPALVSFLKSVSFVSGGVAQPPLANEASPSAMPQMADANTPPANTGSVSDAPPDGVAAWKIPEGWKAVAPTQMLLSKFVIKNADAEADVTVSVFPGDVGGLLANVNRWRNSVSMAPIESDGLEKATTSIDVPGGKATLVDVGGTSPKSGKGTRLIGVIWPRNGQTWFYKLMGDATVAGHERDAFLQFIQSVKYPQ